MEFADDIQASLLSRLTAAAANKEYEFEVNFGDLGIEHDGFKRVINALSVCNDFSSRLNHAVLDIGKDGGARGARLTVVGKDNIESMCRRGALVKPLPADALRAIVKTEVDKIGPLKIPDFGIAVNTRRETKVADAKVVASELISGPKLFRYKQRVSFTSTAYAFTVDCSVVNQSRSNSPDFHVSAIFESQPRYEIEIELTDKKAKPADCLAQLAKIAAFVYRNLENSPYITPLGVKTAVVDAYMDLVAAYIPKNRRDARTMPSRFFIGPKPMSISWENLLPAKDTRITITDGYSVTDKADGVRMMLYVAQDGRCYLLDNVLDAKFTGITAAADLAGTLIDGEYVDSWKVAKDADIASTNTAWFMAFDVYYHKGKFVGDLPLKAADAKAGATGGVADRLGIIDACTTALVTADSFVKFHAKAFLFGDDIFADAKKCIGVDRQYETDGVIFTPLRLPVGANYEKEQAKMTGRWSRVLKWKPPEQNTVDFLVRFVSTPDASRYVKLYVGYNTSAAMRDGQISPQAVIMYDEAKESASRASRGSQYVERQFADALLPLDHGKCFCANGDVILNDSVVEFSYDVPATAWRPLRVRHDKTHVFRRTGAIAGTANDYETAGNIWKTIRQPVTQGMICGDAKVAYDQTVAADGLATYYVRDTDRDRLEMKPTLDFHNHWVKKVCIFDRFKRTSAASVLDVGCGRGGDLMRCINAGFKTVLGLDLSESDLMNPDDGAYARLLNLKASSKNVGNERIVYAQWDCGRAVAKENDIPKQNKGLQEVGDVVFSFLRETAIPRSLVPLYGMGNKAFDVVSCQFAAHYFFKNAETLGNFCGIVGSRLRKGGYFVCTCMDADLIDKMFTKAGSAIAKGAKAGKVIWMLTKRYDAFDYDDPQQNYGKEIDVFLESVNQTVKEYLVDYALLCAVLAEHGVVPVGPTAMGGPAQSFRDLYAGLEAAVKSGKDTSPGARNAVDNMSAEEKKFSFVNKVYFFVKS